MAAYDSAASKAMTDDLKVFLGTIADIKAIVSSGKVVNRKWYLSWDTGEFFVGNGTKKLYKFGGSNNDLSKDDIISLITSYTAPELSTIKGQIAVVVRQLTSNNSKIETLSDSLETEISKLNTETRSYIEEQVKIVLRSAESITYSKTKINTMILDLQSALEQRSYTKAETNVLLADQKTEVENYASGLSVWHLTGNEIATLVAEGKTSGAFCLCSEKSSIASSNEYLQGHIYAINKQVATDITAGGTGSSSYIAPILTLTVGGKSSVQILIGASYAQTTVFDYTVSNPENISSSYLALTQNSGSTTGSVRLSSTIPISGSSYSTITSLSKPLPGSYLFTLSCVDKKNTSIYGNFSVVVRSPIYYGHNTKAVMGDSSTETTSEIQIDASAIKQCHYATGVTAAGKYTFTSILDSEYIWFFIPSEVTFNPNNVYLNGFSAKFNSSYTTITISFNGVNETYKCYRSVNSLQKTDSVTLTVTDD